jgi:hypothetical protein
MRLPEQRFWDRTRRRLSPHLHLERIENLLEVGTPDLITLAPSTGRVVRLELKAVAALPVRTSTPILGGDNGCGLSLDQRNWHKLWTQMGGTSAILVGIGSDLQFLVHGVNADEINSLTTDQINHGVCVEAYDWDKIVEWMVEK